MRLTNSGIKYGNPDSFETWLSNMPGSKTQSAAEMQNDKDTRTDSEGVVAPTPLHSDMEVQYAMATAGYQPTVSELGGLMLRSPQQFASAEVAIRNTVEESAALAATVTLHETVAYDETVAA